MRVIVADSHTVVRRGIEGLLLATDMRVVGEAEDGEETVRLAEELRPDLVILGLNLTGEVDGIGACRRIKALPEPPRVLVHAAHAFSGPVLSSLVAEADGYLHKGAGNWELLEAMRRAAAGERVWPSEDEEANGKPRHFAEEGADLTPREREVLALMLCRCTNAEIAQRLRLTLPTVKTHARRVLRKMGAENREDLLRSHAPGVLTL